MNKIRTVVCVSVATATVIAAIGPAAASVSGREVKKFLADIERMQQADYEQLQEQLNRVSYAWVQPQNKAVECKVIFAVDGDTPPENPSLYWDGECEDGYASGLGREFYESAGGLSSWLGEYGKPGEKPVYYYVHDYDSKTTSVGFNDAEFSNPVGVNGVQFQFSGDNPDGHFYVRQQYYDPETGRAYFLSTESSKAVVTRGISYSAGLGYLVQTYLGPAEPAETWAYFANRNGTPFRYGIARLRKGPVVHIAYDDGEQRREAFPIELVEQFTRLEWEINAKLKAGQDDFLKGYQAVEAYRRKTCRGDLDVDFMDPVLYGQICLQSGDFTPYIDGIAKATGEAMKRREADTQDQDFTNNAVSTFQDNFALPALRASGLNADSRRNAFECRQTANGVSCEQVVDMEE